MQLCSWKDLSPEHQRKFTYIQSPLWIQTISYKHYESQLKVRWGILYDFQARTLFCDIWWISHHPPIVSSYEYSIKKKKWFHKLKTKCEQWRLPPQNQNKYSPYSRSLIGKRFVQDQSCFLEEHWRKGSGWTSSVGFVEVLFQIYISWCVLHTYWCDIYKKSKKKVDVHLHFLAGCRPRTGHFFACCEPTLAGLSHSDLFRMEAGGKKRISTFLCICKNGYAEFEI